MKTNAVCAAVVLAAAALDQVTKSLVVRSVPLYQSVPVVPGFMNLTHVRNRGAIFGFFSHTGSPLVRVALIAAALAALTLVIVYFLKTPASDVLMKLALALILAGALGNQLDRTFRGYVVDFVDLYVRDWHWFFFNLADACITTGAGLLLVRALRRPAHASQPV